MKSAVSLIFVNDRSQEYNGRKKLNTLRRTYMMKLVTSNFSSNIFTFRLAFEEFRGDNIQHLEIRTVLPLVCRGLEECDPLTEDEVAALYKDVADDFLNEFPDFCGISMIYAPIR